MKFLWVTKQAIKIWLSAMSMIVAVISDLWKSLRASRTRVADLDQMQRDFKTSDVLSRHTFTFYQYIVEMDCVLHYTQLSSLKKFQPCCLPLQKLNMILLLQNISCNIIKTKIKNKNRNLWKAKTEGHC